MRLDHLLSKEEEVGVVLLSSYQGARATGSRRGRCCACTSSCIGGLTGIGGLIAQGLTKSSPVGAGLHEGSSGKHYGIKYTSGGDTFRGNTRPHLEHDG